MTILTSDKQHLIVLDDFRKDWDLPKFKKPTKGSKDATAKTKSDWTQSEQEMTTEPEESSDSDSDSARFSVNPQSAFIVSSNATTASSWGGASSFVITQALASSGKFIEPAKKTWWQRFKEARQAKKVAALPTTKEELSPPAMTIEEFFGSIKNSAEEIRVVKERARGYQDALARAKASGQKALFEQLSKALVAYRSEAQLYAMGLKKYVTEERIVEFYKKCAKGLRLDYTTNFTRMIPADLIAKKVEADKRCLFDNYVVLHYDPQAKSFAETEEEKARRKDPILFGLIEGQRKLYYVGDWVDEFCDLTLDQIAETLGKGSIEEIPKEIDL